MGQGSIALPAPRLESETSLEQALSARHSVRSFSAQTLTWVEISQLLWAAQGITRDWGARTAPSAGALYPLEIYVSTATGVYHYLPQGHQAIGIQDADAREGLWQAGLKQDAIRQAPTVFIITATYERTSGKYGDRAVRYVHLEAGHAAQNLLLQAVALGLGGVPIGAFDDAKVQAVLGLPEAQKPLYLIPIGYPED
jgi:SagB-type dehydrogenase family enzyme